MSGSIGYIDGAFVLPGYRDKGIMKNLEGLLVEYFKKTRLNLAALIIITNDFIGKKSWESLGYKTFREQMRKRI